MKRWHEDLTVMQRRYKIWEHDHFNFLFEHGPNCLCHQKHGLGLFRKRHPRDCGHTRCPLCHWEKYYMKPSRQNGRYNTLKQEEIAEGFDEFQWGFSIPNEAA